jgi:predicted nucleic acid-binding protein
VTVDKVVDASAWAAVIFLEPGFEATEARLDGLILHAPKLLRFEMANICLKKLRTYPTERDLIRRQYEVSFAGSIQEHEVDYREVVSLAERHKLTAYDASYLWLAKQLHCELVTVDGRLAAAALAI